ncbi:hypothetical protein DTO013E5_5809 [Penicillium roqueforti]|nr:hypothetical protein DTO012A1_7452 [Penicillium roqueforti]KAI2738413.1 hypothetical protein DTO013F2_9620 [Penicillium roqueforti]KAI2772575.1 hypothetical protein DTO012A8_2926 [Penicillium roqueforti]KAI3208207.1 hypothetical protein DTO013E5_5809 [Penicillium roqueforti]KAI3226225.1 hypothetical protein DTO012A9_9386 [Penicillium roqueforti]
MQPQRNWNHSATDTPNQQRRQLIHQFLNFDEIPEEYVSLNGFPPLKPTSEEIDIILQPWRSDSDLRRKAYYMSKDNVLVFLRTHYNPDDNDRMNEWGCGNDLFEDNAWWACLNDPYLFNFGSDWQQVYEIMPEFAGPVDRRRQSADPTNLEGSSATSERSLHTKKPGGFHEWTEHQVKKTEESANPLQNVTIAAYIVIADQESFQTGLLQLFCLDDNRKIVWEARVDRKPAEIMRRIRHSGPALEL